MDAPARAAALRETADEAAGCVRCPLAAGRTQVASRLPPCDIKTFLLSKRRKGYAKNSVRLMKAPLSVLLSDAVDDGIIAVNPALQRGRRRRRARTS